MRFLLVFLLASAAVAQAPASYKPYAALADLMAGILLPNSDAIFNVTRKAPTTDEGWIAIQTSAAVLAESGNLLLLKGRRKENGEPVPQTAEWRRHVQALVEAAKGVHKAALAKDADAIFEACEPLYQACFTCHETYRFCATCQEAPPKNAVN